MAASAPELYALMNDLPIGAWVAISTEKVCVLAHGDDEDAVFEEAMRKGDAHPLITRVPDPNVRWCFPGLVARNMCPADVSSELRGTPC